MSAPTSLLDWLLGIMGDPSARAAFQSDPGRYAAQHGFQGLSAADVHDALYLIADNASASYDHEASSLASTHYYPPPQEYDPNQPAEHYLNHYVNNYLNEGDAPMATQTSLLDWLLSLLRDPQAREAFQDDPQRYLERCGFDHASGADLQDALTLISDDDSHRDHRGGGHHESHYPPPHHYSHHSSPAHYLHDYITNNYTTIQEHNTNIDDSVHQHVDTHGGDFNQTIDNDPVVASGDGAVAARGNIDHSTLTSGDGNVVGDGNHAVTGNDNTTSFGSGSANDSDISHSRFGDGSGVSTGGDAYGQHTDNDTRTAVHSSGSGETSVAAAGAHGEADQYADQSAHDNSDHSSYEDNSRTAEHNTYDSDNTDRYSDSHDSDIHH